MIKKKSQKLVLAIYMTRKFDTNHYTLLKINSISLYQIYYPNQIYYNNIRLFFTIL